MTKTGSEAVGIAMDEAGPIHEDRLAASVHELSRDLSGEFVRP